MYQENNKQPLAEKILEAEELKLPRRIQYLSRVINQCKDEFILIIARECLLSLLKNEPRNARLNLLIKKVNSKIIVN
jgi:hypothetical protein